MNKTAYFEKLIDDMDKQIKDLRDENKKLMEGIEKIKAFDTNTEKRSYVTLFDLIMDTVDGVIGKAPDTKPQDKENKK